MRKEITGEQESVTWLNEKDTKAFRSVAAFISNLSESIKLLRSTILVQVFGKTSSNYWLWNVVPVWFFLIMKHCCNHRSKRIEAVRFHHINCGSWTKQVVISSHNGAIMCHFDRTKDGIWTWTGNFYAAQKQDYCCEERQNSPSWFVKHKAQHAVVLSLEVADGMVKTTLKQLGKKFNSFYVASDLYLNLNGAFGTQSYNEWR